MHGSEDHPWFENAANDSLQSGRPVQSDDKTVVLYHYFPIFPGARYGFHVLECRDMESYLVEKKLTVAREDQTITIVQPVP